MILFCPVEVCRWNGAHHHIPQEGNRAQGSRMVHRSWNESRPQMVSVAMLHWRSYIVWNVLTFGFPIALDFTDVFPLRQRINAVKSFCNDASRVNSHVRPGPLLSAIFCQWLLVLPALAFQGRTCTMAWRNFGWRWGSPGPLRKNMKSWKSKGPPARLTIYDI